MTTDDLRARLNGLRYAVADLEGYDALKAEVGAALDGLERGLRTAGSLRKAVYREGGFADTLLGRDLLRLANDYDSN